MEDEEWDPVSEARPCRDTISYRSCRERRSHELSQKQGFRAGSMGDCQENLTIPCYVGWGFFLFYLDLEIKGKDCSQLSRMSCRVLQKSPTSFPAYCLAPLQSVPTHSILSDFPKTPT